MPRKKANHKLCFKVCLPDTIPLSARVDPIGSKRPARPHALYPRAVRFKARTHTRPPLNDAGLRQPICALLCEGVSTTSHRPGKSLAPRRSHGKRGPEHQGYLGTPAKPHRFILKRQKSGWFLQARPCQGISCVEALRTGQSFAPPRRWLSVVAPTAAFSSKPYSW